MKWDRVIVFVIATGVWTVANLLPNNFPQKEYGRGFPLKWTYDPASATAVYDEDSPYRRTYSPKEKWKHDNMALLVNVLVGIVVVSLVLCANEIVQISCGNRPPRIPPNV